MNDTADFTAMRTVRAGMMMKQHPGMDYHIARQFVTHSHIHVVRINYKPTSTLPQVSWCHEHLEEDGYRRVITHGLDACLFFAFKNDQDAVMFKLRWG
jgi:hypothetical protein